MKEIIVDGIIYVPKNESQPVIKDGLEYVCARSKDAGVFVGWLKSEDGDEVTLLEARRIWYWDGAASLSQLSTDGVSKPQNCKFPAPVSQVKLKGVCEILPVTEKAKKSIEEVKPWKQ